MLLCVAGKITFQDNLGIIWAVTLFSYQVAETNKRTHGHRHWIIIHFRLQYITGYQLSIFNILPIWEILKCQNTIYCLSLGVAHKRMLTVNLKWIRTLQVTSPLTLFRPIIYRMEHFTITSQMLYQFSLLKLKWVSELHESFYFNVN